MSIFPYSNLFLLKLAIHPFKVTDMGQGKQGVQGTRIRTGIKTRNIKGIKQEQPEAP